LSTQVRFKVFDKATYFDPLGQHKARSLPATIPDASRRPRSVQIQTHCLRPGRITYTKYPSSRE